jgi:hypothetical protein
MAKPSRAAKPSPRPRPARRAAPLVAIEESVAAAARAAAGDPTLAAPEPFSRRAAEADLLRLAREISAIAQVRDPAKAGVRAALALLARAYTEGPLPRALFHAWLHRSVDESAALALAWAREQLRLALEEVIDQEAPRGRARTDVPAATLAWMLLAACEAMAHEPAGSVDDRLETLVAFSDPSREAP